MSRHSKQDVPKPDDLNAEDNPRHGDHIPEGRKKQMDQEQGGGEGGGDKKPGSGASQPNNND